MEVRVVAIFSSEQDSRFQVERMASRMYPIEGSRADGFDDGGISLRARIAPWADQIIAHDSGTNTRLAVVGHAWRGNKEASASTLLEEYLHGGEATLATLGGSFAVLIWEPSNQTLRIVTDRLATKKIYLAETTACTLLATELRSLLAHPNSPRTIDDAAVGQFLITSHLVDTCTLIQGVSVVPPGSICVVNSNGIKTRAYWTPCIHPGTDDGIDAWADRLAHALRSAIHARCNTSGLVLPLSGGLDARTIAAFLPTQTATTAHSCTFGPAYCYDVRYGRAIARALGAKFSHLQLPTDFFSRYLDPVQTLCDGEVSIEALPMYRLLDAAAPGQLMMTGFLGDALSGGHLLGIPDNIDEHEAKDLIWAKKYQGKGFSEELLGATLLPERYKLIEGRTRALMESDLERAQAETLDEKALVVELHHRQSRYISYLGRMLSARYRVENPFLDLDVLDVFLTLPLAHRKMQRAYRRMLTRHAPKLAAVKEQKTRKPVAHADLHGIESLLKRGSHTATLPHPIEWRINATRKSIGNRLAVLSGGWLGSRDRKRYVHHDINIRSVDPGWFRSQLLDDLTASEWFRSEALERLYLEHINNKRDHSIRINNVIAILHAIRMVRSALER